MASSPAHRPAVEGYPAPVPCVGLTRDVTLTAETILATREHYADLAERCIAAATESPTPGPDQHRVNDLARYTAWQRDLAARSLAGEFDHGFTHRQHGHWLQTGESVPFLPPSSSAHAAAQHALADLSAKIAETA